MISNSPESRKTGIIRELNDKLRQNDAGGKVLISGGLSQEDSELINRVREAVRTAKIETGDGNDPHGEHDFGSVEVSGERYFWKIDYYNLDMSAGSEDASDESQTKRLLTIMRAEDY